MNGHSRRYFWMSFLGPDHSIDSDNQTYIINKYKSKYMLIESIIRDIEGPNRIRTCDRPGYKPLSCTVSFCIKFRGKKEKNVLKGGPGRNRTCDLADNGFIPTRL